jgi:hypothetical protein
VCIWIGVFSASLWIGAKNTADTILQAYIVDEEISAGKNKSQPDSLRELMSSRGLKTNDVLENTALLEETSRL